MARKGLSFALCLFCLAVILIFSSCGNKKNEPLIIWTDIPEFASYAELFNKEHANAKAIVVYKEEPARSLPPLKDEIQPDLVVSSWLKNSSTRKYFLPLDYMFSGGLLQKSEFYSKLLDYGLMNSKQYLLPVSFNLDAVMFRKKNETLVTDDHFITLDGIKKISSEYNKKNDEGSFEAMGYAPSWDGDFLYLASRMNGAEYVEKKEHFDWNAEALQKTAEYMKGWTLQTGADTDTELNFQFKYLYMPKYKQFAQDKSFFAFIKSSDLFMLTEEQFSGLTYRWVGDEGLLPVEDDIVTMGLFKSASHKASAQKFIQWFYTEDVQKRLLERQDSLKLDSVTFGIAGGFSALAKVNANVYPLRYRSLLENLPMGEYLSCPNILSPRWPSLKEKVVIPYLLDSIQVKKTQPEGTETASPAAKEKPLRTIEQRISAWERESF
ncbi:MAG: hypothetical protein K6E22_06945 [Treponema sp.]|nr:hypothetical protein [Treponema sp.]